MAGKGIVDTAQSTRTHGKMLCCDRAARPQQCQQAGLIQNDTKARRLGTNQITLISQGGL